MKRLRGAIKYVPATVTGSMIIAALCLMSAQPAVAGPPNTVPSPVPPRRPGTQTGIATYYGAYFHGKLMANGKRFNMYDPTTTASNSWPLGTRLRIRRLPGGPWDASLSAAERNRYFNRSIVVVVRDRGAFTHALDLSQAAFAQLGRTSEGVIRVEIEPLDHK